MLFHKLKLNGGDIKSVQGDSGHSQVDMVTDVYSHIIDEDRRKNAELFEEAFYKRKNLNPNVYGIHSQEPAPPKVTVPENIDPVLLQACKRTGSDDGEAGRIRLTPNAKREAEEKE